MHRKAIDLTGNKYHRLKVISRAENKGGKPAWNCVCDCGNEKVVTSANLKSGSNKSCGCYIKEITSLRRKTHGMRNTPTYSIWRGMIDRCTNPNSSPYKYYGARGITVCERWLESFENFYADMGERPKGLSIDRIKNNKGYSPDNCKWSTNLEQGINKGLSKNNKSGRKGVIRTPNNKWRAYIGLKGVNYQLGTHENFKDACKARDNGEIKYYGALFPRHETTKVKD